MDRLGYLPIYEKENAFSYLDQYDKVAIVDSDIWIRPDAPNIFESFGDEYDFGGVAEREMPITEAYKQRFVIILQCNIEIFNSSLISNLITLDLILQYGLNAYE